MVNARKTRPSTSPVRLGLLALAFVFLVATPCLASATSRVLKLGAAEVDITPPAGWRKAGGYDEVFSTGVNDPLRAKALAFEQGDVRAALVVCDLTGMSRKVCDRARALASRSLGIPVASIAISATHTHGAPEYHGVLWEVWHRETLRQHGKDASVTMDYQSFLAERCVQAIRNAWQNRRPVTLSVATATQPGIAFNRRFHMKDGTVQFNPGKRNPNIVKAAGPVDTDLPILLARNAETDRPVASLTAFAMHVATFWKNDQFGADFPAVLQTELRRKHGPDFVSVFGEGAAGDVNHFDVSTELPHDGATEPIRIGAALARTVLDSEPSLESVADPALAVRSAKIRAPVLDVTSEQIARAEEVLGGRLTPTPAFKLQVEAYRVLNTRQIRTQHGETFPMEVQAFRLGDNVAIVTLPHEVFTELGMAIKKASPFAHTFVITIANEVDWYVPTRKAFAEGSYEVETCPLKPGCGELLVATATKLLRDLGHKAAARR